MPALVVGLVDNNKFPALRSVALNIVAHLVIASSIYCDKSKIFHICFTDVVVCLHPATVVTLICFLISWTFSLHCGLLNVRLLPGGPQSIKV